jgi:hypothetical protein
MSYQLNGGHSLDGVVHENAALPSMVFCQGFKKYAFFDLDVATSPELATGLNKLIESCFGVGDIAEAFSAISRESLGTVVVGNEWLNELLKIGQSMRDAGDCGGIILLPASGRWVVFQQQPIDLGVLALNCGDSLNRSTLQEDGCFFDCEDIIQWMQGNTERDANLRENFGEELLSGLLGNYCNC